MIYIPFIYFLFLSLFLYNRKKTIDIASFISLLYTFSAFFSILLDWNHLRDYGTENYEISPFACFSYCFLLTLNLLPFISYPSSKIKLIKPLKNDRFIKIIAFVASVWFILVIFLTWGTLKGVLSGNALALRSAIYNGTADDYMSSIPSFLRILFTILEMIFSCAWIHLFLAFYCWIVQKMRIKYFLLFLFTSLSSIWFSVLGIDRSGVAYYLLSLIAVYIFFYPMMSHVQKKSVSRTIFIILGVAVFYLGYMTISRFGGGDIENTDFIGDSLISYLGQNYVNYCYLFDTFDNPEKTLNLLFPMTAHYIFRSSMVSGVVLQEYIGMRTGQELGIFYTYLGQILITAGHIVMFLFVIIYTIISFFFFRKRKSRVSPCLAFIYLWLSTYMILGLYTYHYASPSRNSSVLFFMIIMYISSCISNPKSQLRK